MVRLNKFIASSGCCSRRKADELILAGRVSVNGKPAIHPGQQVDPQKDVVELDGKRIKPVEKKIYIKLYKPRGYLTALGKDRFGRKTLTDLFKEKGIDFPVFPAGRLDYDSEGLLILTNDGEFANTLMHPSKKIPKTYVVQVKGRVNLEKFNSMRKGRKLEDTFLKPDDIKILKKGKNDTWLEITIHSGQKRVVRRFMSSFGHPVKRLIRTKVGRIELGNLKPGMWEKISDNERKRTINLVSRK
ncbi:pseudouridine synthase [Persephonella sp.]|nr:rRNA pseudouridine synthase [Aquificota bacterium]